jgi:uncharacterized membrane protein YfcA
MSHADSLYLGLAALAAGCFGGLLGIGGGLIMVPAMVVWLEVPIETAVVASLVGVVATSTASSLVYLRRGETDMDLGTSLLLFSVTGAVAGTLVAQTLFGSDEGKRFIAGLFAAVLIVTSVLMVRNSERIQPARGDSHRVNAKAAAAVFGGGVLSALLGIGGGIINVPAITLAIGAPVKAATATSAFMIGVTAAAGAAVYAWSGLVNPSVAGPAVLGVLVGAQIGARASRLFSGKALKIVFACVLLYMAFVMARRSFVG